MADARAVALVVASLGLESRRGRVREIGLLLDAVLKWIEVLNREAVVSFSPTLPLCGYVGYERIK
jgi:hypothetical protein